MRTSCLPRSLVLALLLGFGLSCSTSDNDNPVGPGDGDGSGTVGPAGGVVRLESQAGITVPGGALASEITIMVTPAATPGVLQTAGAIAQAYRFTPEGQQFLLPVEVFLFVPEAELAGIDVAALTLLSTTATGIEDLSGITVDIGAEGVTIRGFTTHFSVISAAVEEAAPMNHAPVADAGPDQDANVGNEVTLDGSSSVDPDGDPMTFEWRTISTPGGAVTLTDRTTTQPSFVPQETGVYEFELTVFDGSLASRDTVRVSVTAPNQEPTVDAGTDQSIILGQTATLTAIASDPDGDPMTFRWTVVSQPPGSAVGLVDDDTATTTLMPDMPGSYVLRVTVTDGRGGMATDTVTISVAAMGQNRAPIADAGSDQNATTTIEVTLDGRNSHDPDADPITYAWSFVSLPEGSTAEIESPTASVARFTPDVPGTYVVQLQVSDGELSSTHTVTITAEPFNAPPIVTLSISTANAVFPGTEVTATGTFSDPDGDPLTPSWSFDAPNGSDAELDVNAESTQASFTADVPGHYVVTLSVSDGVNTVQRQATVAAFPSVGGTYSTEFTVTFVSDVCDEQLGLESGASQVVDMGIAQTAPDQVQVGLQALIPNVQDDPVAILDPSGQAVYNGPIVLDTGLDDPPQITANGTLALSFDFQDGIGMPATGFDGGFSFTAFVFFFQCTVEGSLVSPPN